jgi:hypothetical protein
MMQYVGLTDNPDERRKAHANPPDWLQRSFQTEEEAMAWQEEMLYKPGYVGGIGGHGWRYGYTYTITKKTRQ